MAQYYALNGTQNAHTGPKYQNFQTPITRGGNAPSRTLLPSPWLVHAFGVHNNYKSLATPLKTTSIMIVAPNEDSDKPRFKERLTN